MEVSNFFKIDKIGKGAFGILYKVKNKETEEIRVLKIYGKEKSYKEIEESVELSLNLEHPNLMKCYGFFYDRIMTKRSIELTLHLVTVLEFVEGENLHSIISREGKIEPNKMDLYLPQIVSGLQYLHDREIIHRDLKPANIVEKEGKVKLVDYDFLVNTNGEKIMGEAGTPYFTSPEMFSHKSYGKEIDLWALGITIYFCLKGKVPFDAIDKPALKKLIFSDFKPNFSDLPKKYFKICKGLIQKKPEKRMKLDKIIS